MLGRPIVGILERSQANPNPTVRCLEVHSDLSERSIGTSELAIGLKENGAVDEVLSTVVSKEGQMASPSGSAVKPLAYDRWSLDLRLERRKWRALNDIAFMAGPVWMLALCRAIWHAEWKRSCSITIYHFNGNGGPHRMSLGESMSTALRTSRFPHRCC